MSTVDGFENCDIYTIYSNGKVYSDYKNDFLLPLVDSKGYQYISVKHRNPAIGNPKIHRLVMLSFSNDEPMEQINHIDGDKTNNDIRNLEYCTNRENREHALINGLKNEIWYGIAQYDLSGNLLNIFDTARDALRYLGKDINTSGNIGRAINGKRKTAYGYVWKQYEGSTTIS